MRQLWSHIHGGGQGSVSLVATSLTLLLAAFFAAGAVGNTFISPDIAADYARWGYPSWFHYVTAACEIVATGLLVGWRTRLRGAMLGGLVMTAAIATTLVAGEPNHTLAPTIVLAVAMTVAALTRFVSAKEKP